MPALFDGVAGLMLDVFGDPVTHIKGGVSTARHWIFRESPVDISGADGITALDVFPTLRVPQHEADLIDDLDRMDPGNGKIYRIGARQPSGSAASDALVVFELEALL